MSPPVRAPRLSITLLCLCCYAGASCSSSPRKDLDGSDVDGATDVAAQQDVAHDRQNDGHDEGGATQDASKPVDAATAQDGGDAPDALTTIDAADAGADAAIDGSGALDASVLGPMPCGSLCPTGTVLDVNGGSMCHPVGSSAFGCSGLLRSPCEFPGAVTGCSPDGECILKECLPGYADCNKDTADGCEQRLDSMAACGACNNACQAGQTCGPSGCSSSCGFPNALCSSTSCADLTSSPFACGACGQAVTTFHFGAPSTCSNGTSTPSCPTGTTLHAFTVWYHGTKALTECVDTQNDPYNCGTAGSVCDKQQNGSGVGFCNAGQCEYKCLSGRCGDTCAELRYDPANCGACGRTCSSQETCVQGKCEPKAPVAAAGLTRPPLDIAADGDFVFWVDGERVWKVGKSGTPVSLASMAYAPSAIAIDDTHVYWTPTQTNAILRVGKIPGGTVEQVASAEAPTSLAVDASHVYWLQAGALLRAPKTASATPGTTVAASPVESFVLDDANIYLMRPAATVSKQAKAGTQEAQILALPAGYLATLLGVDSTQLYLSASHMAVNQQWWQIPADRQYLLSEMLIATTGGELIARFGETPGRVISHGGSIYYVSTRGGTGIRTVPRCGTTPLWRQKAEVLTKTAADAAYLYYIQSDGVQVDAGSTWSIRSLRMGGEPADGGV